MQILCVSCTHTEIVESETPLETRADTLSVLLASPDERFGELFTLVQTSELFSDSKTFVDAIPLFSDEEILENFHDRKNKPGFVLKDFVADHFAVPMDSPTHFVTDLSKSAEEHMTILWDVLTRQPRTVVDTGTLIPVPNPYVIPGGRFREGYYWDSYFTMLGLQVSDRWDLIENMVDNFAYLIDTLGFIPNGNRTYYLSRSQPPFFAPMVKLLEEKRGQGTLKNYVAQLQREYDFWMDGKSSLTPDKRSFKRVVMLPDGSILNRYWDDNATPRPESYEEDIELVQAHQLKEERYRDIRAAAESGWDFSGRWFKDNMCMTTIHTTDILPVDLNALLYFLESVLADAYHETNQGILYRKYEELAQKRKTALLKHMWNEENGFFHDYDFAAKKQTDNKTLAAMFPLYFNLANTDQAARVADVIGREFLKAGGVTTTLYRTSQQWDAPNGWAPMQWITITGLNNYGHSTLANTIRDRWISLNLQVYKNSGKMVEKYDVYDLDLEAGGGEYPVQDGFGWTNGVLLKLLEQQARDLARSTDNK